MNRVLAELLARPGPEGMLQGGLSHVAGLLDVPTSGLGVLRRGQDQVVVVQNYPRELLGQPISGPWTLGRVRQIADGVGELTAASGPELARLLGTVERGPGALSLVVPVAGRGRQLGALLLDLPAGTELSAGQLETLGRFASVLGSLLDLSFARDEWRQAARQITGAVVEAVESREFDTLGHARAVAEVATRLGRAAGLAEREVEELWYAATLHDVGKIQGEAGHALVGANMLEGVPLLNEAVRAVRYHHERWDGQGEPERLAGEDIPLYARLLAVANTYVRVGDLAQVRSQAGKALDPRLVGLLEKLSPEPRPGG